MLTLAARARTWRMSPSSFLALMAVALVVFCTAGAEASIGDRLPEFRHCVEVCEHENCAPGQPSTPIPLHRQLLLWSCPSECDYTCQHIITNQRQAHGEATVQFHGKWPFYRALGAQEPFSVLFSLLNLWAHQRGLRKVRAHIPASYPFRRFYVGFAWTGIAAWTFSTIFHTRDFPLTEKLDYFGAGASVLYGLYYTVVRLARLPSSSRRRNNNHRSDSRSSRTRDSGGGGGGSSSSIILRAWTVLCASLFAAHVAYLTLVRWDYTYNMAANVVVGVVQNALWSGYSVRRWLAIRKGWTIWPGLAVAWVMLAMSLELFDFPPLWGCLDAHSLWHAGTVAPTVLWYNFLIKDAQDDIAGTQREKA